MTGGGVTGGDVTGGGVTGGGVTGGGETGGGVTGGGVTGRGEREGSSYPQAHRPTSAAVLHRVQIVHVERTVSLQPCILCVRLLRTQAEQNRSQ